MIFIITHSTDVTADFQCARLDKVGARYVRLDSDTVANRVRVRATELDVQLAVDGHRFGLGDVTCVWMRRPKPIEVDVIETGARMHASSEWGEALEGFLGQLSERLWINHPARNSRASHKIEQLSRAQALGLEVPSTLVTQDAEEAREFFDQYGGRIIVKPLYAGYIERQEARSDSTIFTSRVRAADLDHDALLRKCPTLFQAEVDKHFDVRACYVDGRLRCVKLERKDETGHQILDIRRDNMAGVNYEQVEAPADVADALTRLVGEYGLRFAAIDLGVTTDGRWVFFEVNPNGQWAWLDLAGVTDIAGDLTWAMLRT